MREGTRKTKLYTHLILGEPGYGKSQMAAWEVDRLGNGIIFSPTAGFPSVLPAEVFGQEKKLNLKVVNSIDEMTPGFVWGWHKLGYHVLYTGKGDETAGKVPAMELTFWLEERGRERQDSRWWGSPPRWTIVIDEGMFFKAFHGRKGNEVSNFLQFMAALRHYNFNLIIAVQTLEGADPNMFGLINRFTFFHTRDVTTAHLLERKLNIAGIDQMAFLPQFKALQYHKSSVAEPYWAVYQPALAEQTVFAIEEIPLARSRSKEESSVNSERD